MKSPVLAAVLMLAASSGALAAPSGWEAATRNSNSQNYVTLYEQPNFGGRQFTYYGDTNEVYREGFKARSAKASGGPWTLCDSSGRPQCQTVSGSAPNINFDVASVEKGQGGQFSQGNQGGRGQGGQNQGGQGGRGGNGQGGQGQGGFGQGNQGDRGRWDDRGGQGNFGDRGDRGDYGRDVHRVRYMCRNGDMLTASFDERRATVEIRTEDDPTVVLSQVRTGSGFRYESRSRQFYGSGDRATYVTPRGSLSCRAD